MDIPKQIQSLEQIAENSSQKTLVNELELLFLKHKEQQFYVAVLGLFKRGN